MGQAENGPVAPGSTSTSGSTPTSGSAVHALRSSDPVLRAAAQLFYARGISAVSVQDIRAQAGTSLKAMYARYPSKEHLVVAYLEETHAAWMQDLRTALADSQPGTDQVQALFTWLEQWFTAPDFAGCGIANTRGQAIGDRARAVVRTHVAELEQLCAQVGGGPESGRSLLLLVEGAIATAAATGDPGAAREAHALAVRALS